MSAYDVEIFEEHELQMLELFAALNDENENEEEDLPPIIQDELPNWYDWGEAA